MQEKRPKVLVGMSGGVDSSLSAALLVEQGYEVIGGFMKNWDDCNWREDRRDAMRVAARLDIPFYTFNFEKEYREKVVDYMVREYEAGRTPNPDVMCNKFMKFDLFLKEADKLGCDFVATGHYARMKEGNLLAGLDPNKDQTYFLCQMPRKALSRVLFPIGDMLKSKVREEARKRGLSVADKKDSQGVCFIGPIDMDKFLKERIAKNPGNIVSTAGKVLGIHEGLAFHTIGQRKGLGIGGGTPYYVVEKRGETNELVVSSNFHKALFKQGLYATDMNWLADPCLRDPVLKGSSKGACEHSEHSSTFQCLARIRYRQPLQKCFVKIDKGSIHVSFKEAQRAVTPGQFIVLYDGDTVLGGGIIK